MSTQHEDNMLELTIIMPCLNECETLAICIEKAKSYLHRNNIAGEILIADNGSTDGSQEIAAKHGARVVVVEKRGMERPSLEALRRLKDATLLWRCR